MYGRYAGLLLIVALVVLGSVGGVAGFTDSVAAGSTTASTSPPTEEWNQSYGGSGSEIAFSSVQTADGGYLFAGHTTTFGAGEWDAWLVKVDSNGNEEWNRTYGGPGYEEAVSIIQAGDGGYLFTGTTASYASARTDVWLVKVDSDGNEQWNQSYGGSPFEWANSVIGTSDGGYLITGYEDDPASETSPEALLIKVNSSGTEQWYQTYGGPADERARSVVETDSGYLFAGSTGSYGAGNRDFWLVSVDFDGAEDWNQTYGGSQNDDAWNVLESIDAGFLVSGTTGSYGAGGLDGWSVKVNASGAEEWNTTFGGQSQDRLSSGVGLSDGSFVLAGQTYSFGSDADAWLLRVGSDGAEHWNQSYGGSGPESAESIIRTIDGGYLLAGFEGSFFTPDAWLLKLEGQQSASEPPVARFTYEPTDPIASESVTFNGSQSFDPDGRITQYAWDFDEDAIVDKYGPVVTHVFTVGGNYAVNLTVTDNDGATNTTMQTIAVAIPATVDVRPGDAIAAINPDDSGLITVAVLNSTTLDIREINVSSLRFGDSDDVTRTNTDGARVAMSHHEDVDDDGQSDLVVYFYTEDTDFEKDDKTAVLVGETRTGVYLEGADTVKIVGR